MRSEKQVDNDLEFIDSAIENVKQARDIATLPGSEKFVAFLERIKDNQQKAQAGLDAYSSQLSMDYVKYQFIVGELGKIINLLVKSRDVLVSLEKDKLALHKELELINDEKARLEKNAY